MNAKDKLEKMKVYQAYLKSRLESDVPKKHTHRPKSLKTFLKHELAAVTEKIEDLKLALGGK